MTNFTNPHEVLLHAAEIISERGQNYGGIEDSFGLAASIASMRLGRNIHPYEVAVMLACVKNARAFATPNHEDSHIDAMAYEAFALLFADDYMKTKAELSDEITYKTRHSLNADIPRVTHRGYKGVAEAFENGALDGLPFERRGGDVGQIEQPSEGRARVVAKPAALRAKPNMENRSGGHTTERSDTAHGDPTRA